MLGTRRLFSQTFLRRKGLSSGSLAVDQLLLVLLGKLFQRGHFGLQGELKKDVAGIESFFPLVGEAFPEGSLLSPGRAPKKKKDVSGIGRFSPFFLSFPTLPLGCFNLPKSQVFRVLIYL